MTSAALKKKRTDAGNSRKVAAEACGISQFRLDRIERGAVTDADVIKSYTAGLDRLLLQHLAAHKPAAPKATNGGGSKPGTKPTARKAPAKKVITKPATKPAAAKKTTPAQPKPEDASGSS
jgi:hypothetical protein